VKPTPASEAAWPRLPEELADRFTKPMARFLHIESLGGLLLLLATLLAVAVANSPWAHAYEGFWELPLGVRFGAVDWTRSLREWINDGLMTLFFFVVALELKRELVLGELRSPRQAAFSIAAALGGMLVPAVLYLLLQFGEPGERGWGTVMATDTAFVIGALALLGRRIPQSLRVFLLSLAIVDDIGAILVVAIGYSGPLAWDALAIGAAGLAGVRVLALVGIRNVAVYVVVGLGCWVAIDASGLHATVAGVCLGLLTPTQAWVSRVRLRRILDRVGGVPTGDARVNAANARAAWVLAGAAVREMRSPVERLESTLHPWVSVLVMPLFALANAGIPLSGLDLLDPVTVAIFVGFTIGKPLGVASFAWLAVRTGLAKRPADIGWRHVIGGGFLAGIGFTMALFIADLAFPGAMIEASKFGVLIASAASAVVGLAVLARPVRGIGAGGVSSVMEPGPQDHFAVVGGNDEGHAARVLGPSTATRADRSDDPLVP
jgi:Na+:H+ antiporter, NhaA family